MKNILFSMIGIVAGGCALGAFLHFAGKEGKLGAGMQSIAKYVNEGFAVDF